MKKKFMLNILLCAAACFVCIYLALVYSRVILPKFDAAPNTLQIIALSALALMLYSVIAAYMLSSYYTRNFKTADSESSSTSEPHLLNRLSGIGAWLLFACALSSLIAAPLAATADYISYAALFGSGAALCALLPKVSLAEKLAMHTKAGLHVVTVAVCCLAATIFPAAGFCIGIFGIIFTTTVLREEKAPKKLCIRALLLNVLALLLSALLTFAFIYTLFAK